MLNQKLECNELIILYSTFYVGFLWDFQTVIFKVVYLMYLRNYQVPFWVPWSVRYPCKYLICFGSDLIILNTFVYTWYQVITKPALYHFSVLWKDKTSVRKQNGERWNGGNKKTTHPSFPKNEHFLSSDTHTYSLPYYRRFFPSVIFMNRSLTIIIILWLLKLY